MGYRAKRRQDDRRDPVQKGVTKLRMISPIELDDRWDTVQKGVEKLKMILEGETDEGFCAEEHINLYSRIYDMCIQKDPHDYSQQLYDKYKKFFDDYINSKVIPSLREKHDEFLLRELVKRWTNHKIMVKWLSHFFAFLDRFFVPHKLHPMHPDRTLAEAGRASFRDRVYKELRCKAADVIITLIDQEREGMVIDGALLKNAVDLYLEIDIKEDQNAMMDCYENDFEKAMLNETAVYYSRKASDWIVKDSCPEYILKVEECLRKEKDRVSHYLHSSSEAKLMEKVQNQLLVVHANQLLEKEHSGCRALLRDGKVEELSRMYRLFQKVPEGLKHIADIFKQHVSSEGMVLIKQTEDAVISSKTEKKTGGAQAQELALVTRLIELHDKFLAYVSGCFLNDYLFHRALRVAFEAFCNNVVGGSTSAEILASYCDDILKKGGAGKLSDETTEENLDKVVNLLAYISDKDLFAEFYRKKLSRRLLFERSTNNEQERFILTKLKQQCGGQFTSKMEGMVNDLTLAKENQNQFQEYVSNNHTASLGMELNVTVITTGFWPSYKSSDLSLPAEMAKCVEVFKEFYQTKTNNRRLTWVYSLGTCNINGKFEQKTIGLIVTTYQAAVLLLFNNADKLSYSDIKTQLNLGDDDLVRLLHSLSCGKYKILNKEPSNKSVSSDDYFEFNSKFTDKMRRIKIALPPADERKKVAENVEKDRRYCIDAMIVRIMKSRKILGYQELVMECVEQLSRIFKPDLKEIKKRIEDLIARDYLERDHENPKMFKYLA